MNGVRNLARIPGISPQTYLADPLRGVVRANKRLDVDSMVNPAIPASLTRRRTLPRSRTGEHEPVLVGSIVSGYEFAAGETPLSIEPDGRFVFGIHREKHRDSKSVQFIKTGANELRTDALTTQRFAYHHFVQAEAPVETRKGKHNAHDFPAGGSIVASNKNHGVFAPKPPRMLTVRNNLRLSIVVPGFSV